jgi:hypothetical protein
LSEINLHLDHNSQPSNFIIKGLKDLYDGILGMPWVRKNGHRIDWINCIVRTTGKLATAEAALPYPPNTPAVTLGKARIMSGGVCVSHTITPPQCELVFSPHQSHKAAGKLFCPVDSLKPRPQHPEPQDLDNGGHVAADCLALPVPQKPSMDAMEPFRHVRNFGKGVRVLDTSTPPQCEFEIITPPYDPVTAGKPVSLLESSLNIGMCAAQTLWSMSARLAARQRTLEPNRKAEELVPRCYHWFLPMFRKMTAATFPPRRKYDFRVDLIPGANPQAGRVIPLSPAKNEALNNS